MAWYTKVVEEYGDEALARVLSRYKSRAEMLRAWETFDWAGFEDALLGSLERPLLRYVTTHAEATFTKLVIDANAAYGGVLLSLDTGADRDRRPGDYQHRDLVTKLSAFKTWQKLYVETLELIGEVETLDDVFDEIEDDDLPDSGELGAAFLGACARVAFRLEQVARTKSNAAEIEALAWEHDESSAAARARMASVRKAMTSARSGRRRRPSEGSS